MTEQNEIPMDENEVILDEMSQALDSKNSDKLKNLASELHAADIADFIEDLNDDERKFFVDTIKSNFDSDILTELEPEFIEKVTDDLGAEGTADALSELNSDEVIEIVEEFEQKGQQEIINSLPEESRAEVQIGLGYPEDSVGRLMHKKYVTVPEYWNVGQVIDYLRSQDDLPEDFHVVYIVDPKHRPLKYILTSRIMRNVRATKIIELAEDCKHLVKPEMDQEDLAYLFRQYRLVSTAVVDDIGRMIGVITTEDVVEIIEEENQEDIMKLGGVTSRDFYSAIGKTVVARMPWLVINAINAFVAAFVIMQFATSIEEIVALAALAPIVAAVVGNAGAQTLTVTVHAIAKKNITPKNTKKYIGREMVTGLANGIVIAILAAGVIYALYQDPLLSSAFAASVIACFLAAGFIGSAIPILLNKMGIDPAIASSAFVIALTDILSFFVFLGLATMLLLS